MKQWKLTLTVLVFLMILAAAVPVAAQKQDDEWQYTVAPYLVFASMDGTLGVRSLEAKVDAYTLSNLQGGFLGYFEARKGNWGFGTDIIYMSLGASTQRVNIDPSQAAFTFLGIRRLAPTVDLQFGARWNVVRGRIEFKDNSVVLAGTVVEKTKQWVDPLVGLRWKQPLGDRWLVSLPVNVGGFGISSKIAVDVFPTLQYKLLKHTWIGGGWRFLYMNYETGYEDGVPVRGEESFRYDMLTSGPVIGAAFRF
jgi:hypothetical protein